MRRGQRNTSAWPRAPAEAGTSREAPGQRASVGLLPQDPCGGKMRLPSGKQKSPRVLVWENEGQDEEITVYSMQESRDDFQLIAPRLSQRPRGRTSGDLGLPRRSWARLGREAPGLGEMKTCGLDSSELGLYTELAGRGAGSP